MTKFRPKTSCFSYTYSLAAAAAVALLCWEPCGAWQTQAQSARCFSCSKRGPTRVTASRPLLMSSEWNDRESKDSNLWRSSDEDGSFDNANGGGMDWQETLARKQDGSFWSSFEPVPKNALEDGDDDDDVNNSNDGVINGSSAKTTQVVVPNEEAEAEAWLQTLASLSAEEVEFNLKEADRADKARQMEEWGFDRQIIANSLGVAVDTALEEADQVKGMKEYRERSYFDEIDLAAVESHTMVEIDEETGEPVRSQHVYVDEHTCIGCTNCAMIAQSTFFMNPEHGRARVFQQWGDDEETIQIAIETCPVDCIHYVPYEELVKLEVERRDQNINFKARLVSQAENGNNLSHRVGGASRFTAPQKISGNLSARCSNCPTRGCKNCPMYGVGQNPEFERKEKLRKERRAKRLLQQQREKEQKSADL